MRNHRIILSDLSSSVDFALSGHRHLAKTDTLLDSIHTCLWVFSNFRFKYRCLHVFKFIWNNSIGGDYLNIRSLDHRQRNLLFVSCCNIGIIDLIFTCGNNDLRPLLDCQIQNITRTLTRYAYSNDQQRNNPIVCGNFDRHTMVTSCYYMSNHSNFKSLCSLYQSFSRLQDHIGRCILNSFTN